MGYSFPVLQFSTLTLPTQRPPSALATLLPFIYVKLFEVFARDDTSAWSVHPQCSPLTIQTQSQWYLLTEAFPIQMPLRPFILLTSPITRFILFFPLVCVSYQIVRCILGVNIRNIQTCREFLWIYLSQTDNCWEAKVSMDYENTLENGSFAPYFIH